MVGPAKIDEKGSLVVISLVALIAVIVTVLIFIIGGDQAPEDKARTNDDQTIPLIVDPEFEILSTDFSPAEDHIVATLEIVNREASPVKIHCQYVVSTSQSGGFAGDGRFYVLQPGENSFTDEILADPRGGPPGLTGNALVEEFDDLNFGITGGTCSPVWVKEILEADSRAKAVQVFSGYGIIEIIEEFGELRYRPDTPETCSYRLESLAVDRDFINSNNSWSDYNEYDGIVVDGFFHSHILTRGCGQLKRESLSCQDWDDLIASPPEFFESVDIDISRPDNCQG